MIKASGKWITFDEKTVLVLERPQAMSLRILTDLIKRVDRAGAKLVLLDERERSHQKETPREAVSRLLGAKQIHAELSQVLEKERERGS